jgi:hypothetical protein
MRIGNEQFLERPTNLKHQPNFMREKTYHVQAKNRSSPKSWLMTNQHKVEECI